MALIHCNFFSKYLSYDTQVNVILPENRGDNAFDDSKPYQFQVLYLLHGRGDDCNAWIRNSAIERYASAHYLAVVIPSGEDSFYANSVNGKEYYSYMTEELPRYMKQWFPISDKPEDTFIAGLSMGGYGAAMIGLRNPDRFAAIGMFSAAINPKEIYGLFDNDFDNRILAQNLDRVFGTGELDSRYNLKNLIHQNLEAQKTIPPIVQYEGTNDFLYAANQEFCQFAKENKLNHVYEEWEGVHDWKFWDKAVEKALNVFPLKNKVLY